MNKAPVNRIIPFSNVDGPGNRTSVFFQGCSFQCKFCHNPETIRLCCHCGACVPACPARALKLSSPQADGTRRVEWSPEACVGCDTCLKICTHSASPRVRWMTVDELAAEIRRTLPYIEGITTSGGDCTLYADFLADLFDRVHAMGKTCLIDGNGALDFLQHPRLLSACDGVMLDVKAADPDWSLWLTGNDGTPVRKELDDLLAAGKLAEVRTVIFPGRDRENESTVRFAAEKIRGACPYRIIRYRPFGVREEYRLLLGEDTTDAEEAEKYAALAKSLGASGAYVV